MSTLDLREWLETDGMGGFAMGTVSGVRTRRYHGLLIGALHPPDERVVLVSGIEAWIEVDGSSFALTSQRYGGDVLHPDGATRMERFELDPWPRWTCRVSPNVAVEEELFVVHGAEVTILSWKAPRGTLHVRPLLSVRELHGLQHENAAFRFDATGGTGTLSWRPYEAMPEIVASHDGAYTHDPLWFRNFQYDEERARGLDSLEDLASPGVLSWELEHGPATLLLAAGSGAWASVLGAESAASVAHRLRDLETKRRRAFATPLHRAADTYVVARGKGKSIIAGYPWFGDWGRDTFIAMRGLCLALGRLEEAREILVEWARSVSEGMVPNRLGDGSGSADYGSADASLWYVLAVFEYFRAAAKSVPPTTRKTLWRATRAILDGYARGTRYGIRLDTDGLLACGEPGVQLTWMDARVGDRVVTARVGKPVEIQALWLNALSCVIEAGGSEAAQRWEKTFERGVDSFRKRFWNKERNCLYDVIDVDHVTGTSDATLRPNQIFAAGGLPLTILDAGRARKVVDTAFAKLWTPMGPRTLAPGEPGYCAQYQGGVAERDSCYHQGTVWPWLAGPFIEAWLVARGRTKEAKAEARARFLVPLLANLNQAGLDHMTEIADAEPPYTSRGCPFQAWSLGEVIRLSLDVLVERQRAATIRETADVPGHQRHAHGRS